MEKQGRPGLATAPALPIRRGIPTTRLDTPGSRRLPLPAPAVASLRSVRLQARLYCHPFYLSARG